MTEQKNKRTLHCHVQCLDLQFNDVPARLIHVEDLTAARQREIEERHAVKMEAASDLAAGVAHHFNNALTPVLGYASLLRGRVDNSEVSNQLRQISNAATRIANLTGQLTVFGRGKAPDFAVLDLNTVLENAAPMLRRLVGSSFQIELACGSQIPAFSADSEMLNRVIVNLVLNARDSMPQGGKIAVTSGALPPSAAKPDSQPSVIFSVEDSGFGISKDIGARVFDPFFTAHETGAHTGLGLALAYSIVKQHHGTIDFKPRPEGGTVFTVMVPCTQPPLVTC